MRPFVNNAAQIRKVESKTGTNERMQKISSMMNVTFVRNGQLTVLPFPFKYLREYVKVLKGKEDKPDKKN